jgi:hypothetical protein
MSCAVAPLTSAQLYQLLTSARQRKIELAMTGIVLYGNERFVQVLGGEGLVVRNLYELIKRDARHQQVVAYADKPIKKRTFREWAIAFQASSPKQMAALAGYLGAADVTVNVLSFLSIDTKLLEVLRDFTLP